MFLAADIPIPAEVIIGAISSMALGLGWLVKYLLSIQARAITAIEQNTATLKDLSDALHK